MNWKKLEAGIYATDHPKNAWTLHRWYIDDESEDRIDTLRTDAKKGNKCWFLRKGGMPMGSYQTLRQGKEAAGELCALFNNGREKP